MSRLKYRPVKLKKKDETLKLNWKIVYQLITIGHNGTDVVLIVLNKDTMGFVHWKPLYLIAWKKSSIFQNCYDLDVYFGNKPTPHVERRKYYVYIPI